MLCGALLLAVSGRAQSTVQVPVPERQGTVVWGELHAGLVVPVDKSSLCPAGERCIFGVGADIGGLIGAQWKHGIGLGLSYDMWFLDSDGVYEVATLQSIRGAFQFRLLPRRRSHPVFRFDGGLALLGNRFRVDALGGIGSGSVGVEIETKLRAVVDLLVGVHILGTETFVTKSDGVLRGAGSGVDVALLFQLGYAFVGHR